MPQTHLRNSMTLDILFLSFLDCAYFLETNQDINNQGRFKMPVVEKAQNSHVLF